MLHLPSFHEKPLLLDGGLATELEAQGHDLRHPLWSAKLLLEQPQAILDVHLSYLQAGADALTTASYQSTIPGWLEQGLSHKQAAAILAFSVELAFEAIATYKTQFPEANPSVVASMGPYGAYLADGSEFHGNYAITPTQLYEHHIQQWEVLCQTPAHAIACETVPSLAEAKVLAQLFAQTPDQQGWISFSCRDDSYTCAGDSIMECAALIQQHPNILGLGINCTAPKHVLPLMQQAREAGFRKPFVIYPNSGESFDPISRTWRGTPALQAYVQQAREWHALGATLIGGCCRTTPIHIAALRVAFDRKI